jgi:hypothetical protein
MTPLQLAFLCMSALGGAVALAFVLSAFFEARSRRPTILAEEIIFKENFASGNSLKNVITRFGGARNCLRLVVTRDLLLVTSWFPFSLITPFYDLEHSIPINRISALESDSFLWFKGIRVVFTDEYGNNHSLALYPRNLEGFLNALGPIPQGRQTG